MAGFVHRGRSLEGGKNILVIKGRGFRTLRPKSVYIQVLMRPAVTYDDGRSVPAT